MRNGGVVALVDNQKGHLQLWKPGEEEPEWTLQIKPESGFQSKIAAMALRSDEEILVVERRGRVLTISSDGRVLSQKIPAYEYVQLSVEFQDVDWSQWENHVEKVAGTAGAFLAEDDTQLYLVADVGERISKVSVDEMLRYPGNTVFLSDGFYFMFKDKNSAFWKKHEGRSIAINGAWNGTWTEGLHYPSALAVCNGWLIVGYEEGTVNFIPEAIDPTKEKLRRVSKQDAKDRSILDAGCLGPNLAYTISEDASNQIQIWDLKTAAAVSWVNSSIGHPGLALAGIAAKSGMQLLSLGDFDVRLWSIENKKMKLLSRYYPKTPKLMLTGAALLSGDFVVWYGTRFWKIPHDGGPATYYAGKRVETMKECDSTITEIKCWSDATSQ